VTFAADGSAAGVLVDAPRSMTEDAEHCLDERLGEVAVTPFEGSPLTVATTFYVP
jgi:hypothetical protein